MPSALAQSLAQHTKPSTVVTDQSDVELTAAESKRPQRARRPSARKIESDEYEASSRGSTRPPTPSKTNSLPKPKKRQHGKRGNHPGRITRPDSGTASNCRSPEPFAMPGSQSGDPFLESQDPTGKEISIGDRATAIQCATDFLGVDASTLSPKTLEKILAAMADSAEDPETAPMDTTGWSAPAILQPARQVVLESRHPSHATETPSGPDSSSKSSSRLAPTNPQAPVAAPVDDDTATESETESSVVELGPGDSVSQRHILAATPPPPAKPNPSGNQGDSDMPYNTCANTDTANPDGSLSESNASDTDSDLDGIRASKYPRLARFQGPHPSYSRVSQVLPHARAQSKSQYTQVRSAAPRRGSNPPPLHSGRAVEAPVPPSESLPDPPIPPTSDLRAILTWATHMAQRATAQNGGANNMYQLLANVLGDLLRFAKVFAGGTFSAEICARSPCQKNNR